MIEIKTGDFRELSQNLEDDSIDAIITDPPYAKEFLPLWGDLGAMAARVLKPGGFLVSYSGAMFLPQVMAMLGEHLEYWHLGGLSHPGAKSIIWSHNIMQGMKPILIYQKPPFSKPMRQFINLLESPVQSKGFHKWGQSVGPVSRLLETFSEPGDLVLDPFLGGGATAVAALLCNRRFIGFEIDPDVADIARRRIERERLFVSRPGPVQINFADAGKARCRICGALIEQNQGQGRKKKFCSDACKQRAYRNRLMTTAAGDVTLLTTAATSS